MKYFFTAQAREDIATAAEYYESQRPGLGSEFIVEVGLGVGTVMKAPNRWPEIADGFRKYRIDRFPFGLIYRVSSPHIVEVYAVFDLRRRPDSWRR